jgi:ketopantoate hydroxymethyltransferase
MKTLNPAVARVRRTRPMQQAYDASVRLMRAGAQMIKIEGGV